MGDWLEERLQPLLVLSSLEVDVVGVDGHRRRRRHVVWVKGVSGWFSSGVPCRRTRHRCCAENRRDEEGGNPPRHIVVPANVQN